MAKKVRKFFLGGLFGGTPSTSGTSGTGGGGADSGQAALGYSGFSLRGLTSTDPANVARNRAAAAIQNSIPSKSSSDSSAYGFFRTGSGGTLSSSARSRARPGSEAASNAPTYSSRTFNQRPAGYDPSVSGEWNYFSYKAPAAPPSTSTTSASTPASSGKGTGRSGKGKGASASSSGMKAGGVVKASKAPGMRGCGCAKRGTSGGRMV